MKGSDVFKPNEFPNSYQLGPVHFSFKDCWVVFFIFILILNEYSVTCFKQTVETLISCHFLQCLIWVYTVLTFVPQKVH